MRVNNVNGTSERTCGCGSWLNHWVKYSKQPIPGYCSEKSCLKKPEVGAHVQLDGSLDRAWYIVPLCAEHNRQTGGSLNLGDSVQLVPANVAATCAKTPVWR